MSAEQLTWGQVHAWRLAQHALGERLARADMLAAVRRTGGIQAQLLSAAELQLWARVEGLERADVQTALWQGRTLIKTWAMRGTLHLLAADELPLYAAARSVHDSRNWAGYFAHFGITPQQQEALMAAVPHVLGDAPLTREELAEAIGRHTGVAALRDLIAGANWGSPLKPSAFRGDLCFGPSRGQSVTFVSPRAWAGAGPQPEPQAALRTIVERYLRAYGPATVDDLERWWWGGSGKTAARRALRAMGDAVVEVDVEGWRALALRETLAPMRRMPEPDGIRLLPLFDAYTIGVGRAIEALLPLARHAEVYRPQGWISAVVLEGGAMRGVWEHALARGRLQVSVRMFAPPAPPARRAIAEQAARLGAFLGAPADLELVVGE